MRILFYPKAESHMTHKFEGGCEHHSTYSEKQSRIRVVVPNLMGYNEAQLPATYHAFYDPAAGVAQPSDGRPVFAGLRPDFLWPTGS